MIIATRTMIAKKTFFLPTIPEKNLPNGEIFTRILPEMRYGRQRRRSRYSSYSRRRRRRINLLPFITVGILGCLVLYFGFKCVGAIFSGVRSESASATIEILQGRSEILLPDTESWTDVQTGTKLFEGEQLRTKSKSRAALDVLEGNMVFLDENSEIRVQELIKKSSGKKIISLELLSGRAWVYVTGDDFKNGDSQFEIASSRARVHVKGTVFDFETGATQDVVRLIKGQVQVGLLDEESKEQDSITVGVGQKLVINTTTLTQIAEGMTVLEGVDTAFSESDWHLTNLEKFFPQEANQIREKVKSLRPVEASLPAGEPVEVPEDISSAAFPKPEILSPQNGERFGANIDTIKIEGTAPDGADYIEVNGYRLTQYQSGDRKWSYFAAKKFGTLLPGENVYTIQVMSRDGQKSQTSLTIYSDGAPSSSEPIAAETTASSFPAPVVTRPAIIDGGTPYQTSSKIVTIEGIVDPQTQTVTVNGFQLQKFEPGKTEFSYIANADYGNLKEGENSFTIVATNAEGQTATTTAKIIYTPVSY